MRKLIVLIAVAITSVSCENYWGKKTDVGFIDIPNYEVREIAYVPVEPKLYDASLPIDVCIGYDELIYVVDSATSEIARYDMAFQPQGRLYIPGITKVVQDRTFNLLAIGTSDTIVNGVDYDLTTIYRIDFESSGILDLVLPRLKRLLYILFISKIPFPLLMPL